MNCVIRLLVEDEDEFAAGRMVLEMSEELAGGASTELFEYLGEFSRARRRNIAQHVVDFSQRLQHTMRRFIEHNGALFGFPRFKSLAARPGFCRKESFEDEPIGRQA